MTIETDVKALEDKFVAEIKRLEDRIVSLERKPVNAQASQYGQNQYANSGLMPTNKVGDKTEHGTVVAVTPGIPGVQGPSVVSHG